MRGLLLVFLLMQIHEPTGLPTLMSQAQAAYADGDYPTAQVLLEQALTIAPGDPIVQLDAGHVYLQQGDIGQALLNYRRAQRSIPRNTSLVQGLAMARSLRVDIQDGDVNLLGQLAAATTGVLSLFELFLLTLMALTSLCIGIGFGVIRSSFGTRLRLLLAGLAVVSVPLVVLFVARAWISTARPDAVVIQPVVSVQSGPGSEYLALFELRAGAEVRLLREQFGWFRFELPDGREGWVAAEGVGRV